MSLCKYKNIFGIPGQGIHSYRIFNIAIFDVLGAILLAYILTKIINIPFWFSLLFVLMFGILIHQVFCVKTTLNSLLFG